jgi:hypothetical protein
MSRFIGTSASLKDHEYEQDRTRVSQAPFKYLQEHHASPVCPDELPYACAFQDGHRNISSDVIRTGHGLTRRKGRQLVSTQFVGPVASQQHNGNRFHTNIGTNLRFGKEHVRRGASTISYDPSAWVQEQPHGLGAKLEPFVLGGISTRFECDF